MKAISTFLSYLFHPLYMVAIMLGIMLMVNPYLFGISDPKAKGLLIISVVMLSILFPLLSIGMMRGLGLISSVHMNDRKERVGPLIATGIFYLWLYINIRSNPMIPSAFSYFVLGCTIALFISFFVTNFSKVSLHAVGLGGLLMGVIFLRYNFSYETFSFSLGPFGRLMVHVDLVIIITLLLSGLIGTCRMYLKAHNSSQIYGGYIVGMFSQIIAFRIFF